MAVFSWDKIKRGIFKGAISYALGQFIVAVLQATGIWPILVAIVTAVVTSVWAAVTGLSPVIAFVILLSVFCFSLGIICFVLYLSRYRRKTPKTLIPLSPDDLRRWSTTDPLPLWQAASLWVDFNPHLDIGRFDSPGYWIFTKLLRAVEKEEIDVVKSLDDVKFCHLSRDALRAFGEAINERPEFLFSGPQNQHIDSGFENSSNIKQEDRQKQERVSEESNGPFPDNSMNWVFDYLIGDSQWALGKAYEGGQTHLEAVKELRDMARLGRMQVWGRQAEMSYHASWDILRHPLREIPQEYWDHSEFDAISLVPGRRAKTSTIRK